MKIFWQLGLLQGSQDAAPSVNMLTKHVCLMGYALVMILQRSFNASTVALYSFSTPERASRMIWLSLFVRRLFVRIWPTHLFFLKQLSRKSSTKPSLSFFLASKRPRQQAHGLFIIWHKIRIFMRGLPTKPIDSCQARYDDEAFVFVCV